ncbi:mitochondrial assembly of ribosomal large subunit protein 1 [Periplaneta americana]|uniref:mitochondrial assembly of ribosomal large subunit protein 1 n=1 Tax=Periplaneta americana TaxID=6978 RepID=UPI0037E98617
MNTLRSCMIRNFEQIKLFNNVLKLHSSRIVRRLSEDDNSERRTDETQDRDTLPKKIQSAFSSKYEVFRDSQATVILDVEEERLKYLESITSHREQEKDDEFAGLNLQRGVRGVFDIEDLVDVLRNERLEDIFVVSLPEEFKYVDYIVVVTAKSVRHMSAVAEFVRKVYKKKRHSYDLIPKIEGKNCKDWMALDLGNIALHIFSRKARPVYDLESLWAIGSQYDLAYNKPDDPLITLIEQHSVYLGDLQPAEGFSENNVGKLKK